MFPKTTQMAVLAVASLFVIGAVVLLAIGRSIDQLLTFATWLVPVLVGVVYNSHQIGEVQNSTKRIEKRVNGDLTKDIKQAINESVNPPEKGEDNGAVAGS